VPPEPDVEPLAAALTSGNLLRLAAFKETGGFMEKLFIDYVDVEYCMRLQIHGFSVLRANRAVLLHRLGGMTSRRFLGLTVHPVDHSPSGITTRRGTGFTSAPSTATDFRSIFGSTSKRFAGEF